MGIAIKSIAQRLACATDGATRKPFCGGGGNGGATHVVHAFVTATAIATKTPINECRMC